MSPVRRLSDRHPFEIYLLTWAFLVSLPGALGFDALPSSVGAQMPHLAARLWAVSLTVGALVALVGLAWRRPPFPLVSVTGLLLERIGLFIVGYAAAFYSVAVLFYVGAQGLVPAGIVLGFGLACAAQALKIGRILATMKPTP